MGRSVPVHRVAMPRRSLSTRRSTSRIEGPMQGIWFWCLFGFGIGSVMIYRAQPFNRILGRKGAMTNPGPAITAQGSELVARHTSLRYLGALELHLILISSASDCSGRGRH